MFLELESLAYAGSHRLPIQLVMQHFVEKLIFYGIK